MRDKLESKQIEKKKERLTVHRIIPLDLSFFLFFFFFFQKYKYPMDVILT